MHLPDSNNSRAAIWLLFGFVENREYLKVRDKFQRVTDPDIFSDAPWHEESFDEKNRIRKESSLRIPVESVTILPDGDFLEHQGEPVQKDSEWTLTQWIEKKLSDTLSDIEKDFRGEKNTQDECMEWKKQDWSGSIRALLRAMGRVLNKEEDVECRDAMSAVINRLDRRLIDTLPDEIAEEILTSGRGNPNYRRLTTRPKDRRIIDFAQGLIDEEPEKYRRRKSAKVSDALKVEIMEKFDIKDTTAYRRLRKATELNLLQYK